MTRPASAILVLISGSAPLLAATGDLCAAT